jgi:hypothetical protein
VLQLTVYRQGQTLTIAVTVGEQVLSANQQQTQQQQQQPSFGQQPFPWGNYSW